MASLYEKLLAMGKDAIAAIELPFKVKKEKKNLELKILELEQVIAQNDLAIQQEKSSSPINWDKLIEAINKRDLNDRKLTQLNALEDEMFSDKKENEE